jgi:hypothetical protein
MLDRGAATGDDDLRWTATAVGQGCPVCAGTAGCGVASFQGGVAVDCSRSVSARPMAHGGWLYWLAPADAAQEPWHSADGAVCAFPTGVARAESSAVAGIRAAHDAGRVRTG